MFRRALDVNPGFVPACNRMGYSLRGLGRNDEAEVMFKKTVELDPDSPNVYEFLRRAAAETRQVRRTS